MQGLQHADHSQGNGHGVVGQREAQILADAPQRRARQREAVRHGAEPGRAHHQVRGLQRHVRAARHGHAHVGGGQRRRVVDAVADHGDALAALAKLCHAGHLRLGGQLGLAGVDAGPRRGDGHRRRVIAREQNHALAQGPQPGDGLARVRAGRIDQADHAAGALALGDPGQAEPPGGELRTRFIERGRDAHAAVPQQTARAHQQPRLAFTRLDAAAGQRGSLRALAPLQAATLRRAAQRLGHRVGGRALRLRGQPQQRLVVAVADDLLHREAALADGAGLVEQHGVHAREPLQGLAALHQHAQGRGAPYGRGDRHRCRQAQRAGAGDDEYGGRYQRGVEPGGPRELPAEGGEQCDAHHRWREHRGHAIRQALDLGAGRLRALEQGRQTREGAGAHLGAHLDLDLAQRIARAARHGVAGLAQHRP